MDFTLWCELFETELTELYKIFKKYQSEYKLTIKRETYPSFCARVYTQSNTNNLHLSDYTYN